MEIFSGKKDELALVFDIGSSSVGGALFYMQKSGTPKIIFSIREPIILEDVVDVDRFFSGTMQSLEIVVNKIYTARLGAPARIFCTLSSLWYVSQTRMINFEKNTPFIFTGKLADSLIAKELDLFKEKYLIKHNNTKDDVRLIELKSIKTMLNGYETLKSLDQKAKQIEMTVF